MASPILNRSLSLVSTLKEKSCFLFGPRQTGKTSLILKEFPKAPLFDLLDSDTYLRLSANPSLLELELNPTKSPLAIVDEIQRIPDLLNQIHRLIEQKKIKFLMTSSSARNLRKRGVNLLGGRARTRYLHPLTFRELGSQFALERAINAGLLPSHYFSQSVDEDLKSYTHEYLQQEIIAEAATRSIPSFTRFLHTLALANGHRLNLTNLASDSQVKRTTLYSYLEILEQTLVAKQLPTWRKSKARKAEATPKLYFFDTGIVRILQGRKFVQPKTREFGEFFETYLLHEIQTYLDYAQPGSLDEVRTWRSDSNFEVDFLLGDSTAIEVKGSDNIGASDLKGLTALKEEGRFKHYLVVSLVSASRRMGDIQILPYTEFLDRLWAGEFLS